MIISHHHRFIFVHIHKCAGTSVEQALAAHMHDSDLVIGSVVVAGRDQEHYKTTTGLNKHSTALEARGHVGAAAWDEFYKFALVRDPVDRLRSLYGFSRRVIENHPMTPEEEALFRTKGATPKRKPYRWKAVRAALAARSFDEFALNPLTMEDKGAHPQWRSLCDDAGRSLVDFVGRVERIEEDWARIGERIGIRVPLGLKNSSGQRGREAVSPPVRERLAEVYARDFEMYGYDA